MANVQLGQLQQEAAQLSTHFSDPETYLKQLERLLESYASPIHRHGRVRGMRPILFSYEVPALVLHRLELEQQFQASQQPAAALAVADALWARRSYETRQLAIRLLGATPAPSHEITARLEAWSAENQEELLVSLLFQSGARGLAEQQPQALLAFGRAMLASQTLRKQILGLGCLQTLLSSRGFDNLPALFNALLPISQDMPRKLQPFLADVLSELAARTPKETAFFLQQLLAGQHSEGSRWVARQVLRQLPTEMQASLRELAK
ncbi:MAG: hypothetical protein KIT29_01780 [Anaerolineales bacterium]|nr:hypothetical protein [Anaerolineales bacterium]